MSRIVAIIGRPNVGKSTMFNRLTGKRDAIVDDMSGVTRDRHYGKAFWGDKEFNVIDTGGYVPDSEDVFEKAIREQVHIAMEEADALIFMVDGKDGITPMDKVFARIVHKSKKPIILAVNKLDTPDKTDYVHEFWELGLGTPFPVSAATGQGTGELLDELIGNLPKEPEEEIDENIPRIAIVGRPNAGKSSLVNALLGKEANIVTPVAGTTRDSVHTRFQAFDKDLMLIDTAGLRKKAKTKENVEFYSTLRAIRSIEECDVAILMVDASRGLEAQDLAILSLIIKNKKGLVIAVNKWDLIEKDTYTAGQMAQEIENRIAPISGVPIIFVSVLEKKRVLKALDVALEVFQERTRKIPTSELNEKMLGAIHAHNPPAHRGRFIRIKYVTQIPGRVPTFLFFTNHPDHLKESYKRYLENKIREFWGFRGVPINVFFRKK